MIPLKQDSGNQVQNETSFETSLKQVNRFYPAPIFDNGCSLLTANQSIDRRAPIGENVKKVVARPFSGSFEKTYEYFGQGFTFDRSEVLEWLRGEPQSMERDVLIYRIES